MSKSIHRSMHAAIYAATAGAMLAFTGVASADSYVVLANKGLPANFQSRIEASGGRITGLVPEIGVAIVESSSPSFREDAAAITGIRSVSANIVLQLTTQQPSVTHVSAADIGNPPFSGEDDPIFDFQWGHDAIDAVEAWQAGHRGAGVRVAVLDSGIDADHPDLAPNLNTALSASFVPGEHWDVRPGVFFNHGTHVAGTIAAADNGVGAIGVAPDAEIIAVKVLSEHTGGGSFGGIVQGIVYATNVGADIINMSLGADIPHNCTFEDGHFPAKDCAELLVATSRATMYARQRGVTVLAAAGNDGRDLDHDASLVALPAQLPGVISIAATAPIGWALDPANTNMDNLASYSNYGQSGIDFSAPGGDSSYPGNELCQVSFLTRPCWVFDLTMSTISGGWGWAAGTSMATPHAAGVAALIIGRNGGAMDPAHVERALRASADDLGKPGNDDAHGAGRVNALRAVTQ